MKLTLNNGSIITYDHDNGIGDIVASFSDYVQAETAAALITPTNVSHITITTDGDSVVGEYYNLVIISTEIAPVYGEDDETVSGYELHIHLREKTNVEILTERVTALEDSQDTQDEAIDDLGYAVSELYEQEG